ncbi:autophagy-related protein 13 [Dothidotthia symphoricarpi CBS 119687]|uniref:Autophagy-related protein 13 n=1 Tax=Dothidotthia symphoricarpi CBS 119687 TaxID=1392245 RepID=A0A6A6AH02_9PLEO|nr:autophagy-related protein 13 [Dothidotthia symphoricarpi CBS 119687]KAF2130194.1 autophagy-related protein 13 [Dothidotthia symphoricarpi CBS 119687]
MHPYQRPSPRTASAANNLQTNPTRTNNQRNQPREGSPSSDTASYSDRGGEEGEGEMVTRGDHLAESDQKHYQKVNQVIQNFFTKAALTIVSSRVILPQAYNKNGDLKQNKWFNVVLDDTDVLQQDLAEWKTMDAMAGFHPPMYIEVYLDIKGLGHKQSLVIHDEHGKRWDVAGAMNAAESTGRPLSRASRPTQVVLERWKIQVGDKHVVHPSELDDPLPNVYKKAVVLFRSLYAYLRFIPAFKYYKSMAKQPANHPALKLNYRITNGQFKTPHTDTLSLPLYPSPEAITEQQDFTPSNSPIGPLCISVQYRTNCEFSVDDSESLLSSQFMGLDDTYFEQSHRAVQTPGSAPVDKINAQETPDVGTAYGSLSTFHQVGPPTGASPISALRAVRDMPSSSPTETPPQKLPPNHRIAQGSKSSLRSTEAPSYPRRTSVSFQPFKAGSLSSSPAPGSAVPPSPGSSFGRPGSSLGRTATTSALNQPRNRTSLTALPQTALRTPSLPNEAAFASSASSSPKPAPIARYSSSFGHRKNRFSTGGANSKTEDDNLSSGKGSVASSIQRGSDVMNDGSGGSSGEVKTDDENISDFLKLLEAKKDLKSFTRSDNAARDANMRKTTAQLSKYQRMRDSHTALSDSVSSSVMLHQTSPSSSRRLSSVPAMIAGTSVSTASSFGKPISPHTPHTPAIPSRLSANSIIEYEPRPHRSRSGARRTLREPNATNVRQQSEDEDQNANGINIPTSPRPWNVSRRSSSVSQQHRNLPEDEPDLFGMRSTSLPTEEAEGARDMQRLTTRNLTSSGLFTQTELLASATRDKPQPTNPSDDAQPSPTSNLPPKRGVSSRGRGGFFSHSSSTSLSTGATSSTERQSRYNFSSRGTAAADDDEPLLFQMSEIGAAASRRSIEEGRGGASTGSAGRKGSPWLR